MKEYFHCNSFYRSQSCRHVPVHGLNYLTPIAICLFLGANMCPYRFHQFCTQLVILNRYFLPPIANCHIKLYQRELKETIKAQMKTRLAKLTRAQAITFSQEILLLYPNSLLKAMHDLLLLMGSDLAVCGEHSACSNPSTDAIWTSGILSVNISI